MKNHRCILNYKNHNDQHPKIASPNKNRQRRINRPTSPIKHLLLMKFRLSIRSLPSRTNPNRIIPSNTLHIRYSHRIQLSHSHLPRRKLRMTTTLPTRQRSIHILYLPLPPYRTRTLLRILHIHRNMKCRNYPFIRCNSHRFHRLCATMRTNIFLRSNSHHKPIICYSLHWNRPCRVNLRRLLSR